MEYIIGYGIVGMLVGSIVGAFAILDGADGLDIVFPATLGALLWPLTVLLYTMYGLSILAARYVGPLHRWLKEVE